MAFIISSATASCMPFKQLVKNQSPNIINKQATCSLFGSSSTTILPKFIKPQRFRMTSTSTPGSGGKLPTGTDPSKVTEAEWKKVLTKEEFYILRGKGTERPGTGEYDSFYPKEGYFCCAACGNPLYSAAAKFKSGCGWPAFDKCYKGSIKTKIDMAFGMRRIEIMCNSCDGHLGHVFEGERMTNTNERHCVNSVSVRFVKGQVDLEEGKLV